MADADFSLLSVLKSNYPSVPITTVLKVMNKFENDPERCRAALEIEKTKYSSDGESEPVTPVAAAGNSNNSNEVSSPGEGRSVLSRIRELQVSHDNGPQPRSTTERHVSTIERSVGSMARPAETKRVSQSVSWTVQTAERPSQAGLASNRASGGVTTTAPQTAPADFTPFMFSCSTSDIPNIDCKTHVGVSHANRPPSVPLRSTSASSSPGEQRRPVKVINIPPGSLSGGSVSPASTPPNSRHIRMHFGDTGGVCTVSTPPASMQRYASTPNVSQHYRSEFRTEASASQPVHSSSIVVNTNSHTNHLTADRKLNGGSSSDSSGEGRRTPNPGLTLKTVPTDFQSSPGASSVFHSGRPLSTPVQASSPGTSHSKPVFVEIKRDNSYDPSYQLGDSVRAPPPFMPHLMYNLNYPTSYNPGFSSPQGYMVGQHEQYPHAPQPGKHPGYNSPPSGYFQPSASASYSPNSYSHYGGDAGIVAGYQPVSYMGHMTGQAPSHLAHFAHYPHGRAGLSPGVHHIPKSPSVGVSQPLLSNRSDSQESEHGMDYDPRHYPFSNMGSRVSSHSSLSSDSSGHRIDRVDPSARPRSGSMQDETDYIRALLQHQKSRMQKLVEDMEQHKIILNNIHSEVVDAERSMIENSHVNKSFPSVEDISQLCENNRSLQTDIQMYMNEIDMYKSGQTPYNKINAQDQQNFFENMPTGQQDPIYSKSPNANRQSEEVSPPRPPPPRPPPPLPQRQPSIDTGQASGGMSSNSIFRVPPVPPLQPVINSGDSEEGESWSCSACTFNNHPALKKCEICEMPRVMPPHPASTTAPPALPPHQPMTSFPPRLTPGIMGNIRPPTGSPSLLGHHHHHHHAGT